MDQALEVLRRWGGSVETRMQVRELALAVLELVSSAIGAIPLPLLRGIAREIWTAWVVPEALRLLDRALGGDGDPTDEVQPPPTARSIIDEVGTLPATPPTPAGDGAEAPRLSIRQQLAARLRQSRRPR